MTPCGLVESTFQKKTTTFCLLVYHAGRSKRFIWNAGTYIPNYAPVTLLYPECDGRNHVCRCWPSGWLLRETVKRLVLDTEELIFTNPITTLEGKNSWFIVACWSLITIVTDGVRCWDKWSSALLNNLEVELTERFYYKEILVMYYLDRDSCSKWWQRTFPRMFQRSFQTSSL
jgi:hypothetical protein